MPSQSASPTALPEGEPRGSFNTVQWKKALAPPYGEAVTLVTERAFASGLVNTLSVGFADSSPRGRAKGLVQCGAAEESLGSPYGGAVTLVTERAFASGLVNTLSVGFADSSPRGRAEGVRSKKQAQRIIMQIIMPLCLFCF